MTLSDQNWLVVLCTICEAIGIRRKLSNIMDRDVLYYLSYMHNPLIMETVTPISLGLQRESF